MFDFLNKNAAVANKIYGVVVGLVVDTADPEGLGRVKVEFPIQPAGIKSNWARVVSFFAGKDRGAFFLPKKNDEVLITFADGDMTMPYVIGALWNGVDKPPLDKNKQQNVAIIKTKSGSTISLDDTENQEKILIEDKKGNQIIIDTKADKITIKSTKDIEITAPKGAITLSANEIKLAAKMDVNIDAKSTTIKSKQDTTIKGAMINLN